MSFLRGYARKLGVTEYLGTWNASTNTPSLVSSTGQRGGYYIVSVPGTTSLDGVSDWQVNDWVIFNGSVWQKIDNSELVTSVAGKTGAVTLTKSDVGLANVPNVDATSRANHTGTQLASTISDFTTAVQSVTIDAAKIDGGVVSNAEFATLDGITTGVSIQSQINGKQPTGNYITALTGDVTASGPGSVAATLSNTGVVAGTYDSLTVDAKGRVTSASVNRYAYKTATATAVTVVTYTTVAQLTTISLPVGLYKFSFAGQMQSAAAGTGVGVRIAGVSATVTTAYAQWRIKQAADGINSIFEYDQLTTATNVTSASVQTANTNFNVIGDGVFRVTVAGTVAIQTRSELANNAVTLQPDSILVVELV